METQSEYLHKQIDKISHRINGQPDVRVVDFLNQQLRPAAGYSIDTEYPSLFGDFPGGESLIHSVGGHVVSHVGYLVREFQHMEHRFRVGIIGSVTTSNDFRRRGLASSLVYESLRHLKARGCLVAVLWSDAPDFYRKFSFYRMGREIDLRFSAESVPEVKEEAVLMDRKKHGFSIWRTYQKHNVKIDRSLEEQQRLFSIPRVKIYVTEKEGRMTSYVAINKGADFKNYIHEWGGNAIEVQRNIAWLQKNVFQDRELTLIAPAHYDLSAFRAISAVECAGVLGMLRILDRKALVEKYTEFLRSKKANFTLDKEQTVLTYEDREIPFKTDEEVLRAIFGEAGTEVSPPLPFFLWGFDSI